MAAGSRLRIAAGNCENFDDGIDKITSSTTAGSHACNKPSDCMVTLIFTWPNARRSDFPAWRLSRSRAQDSRCNKLLSAVAGTLIAVGKNEKKDMVGQYRTNRP